MSVHLVEALLSGMLTSVWVAACLAVAATLLIHFLVLSPGKRYQLWFVVLIMSVLAGFSRLPLPADAAVPLPASAPHQPSTASQPALPEGGETETAPRETGQAPFQEIVAYAPTVTLGYSWGTVLVGVWLGGVVFGFGWIAVQLVGTLRLKRKAFPARADLQQIWSATLGPRPARGARLVSSVHIALPAAIGYLRPVVVLPEWIFRTLRSDEIRQLMLHELAHVQRYDDCTLLAHRLLQVICWWNPLVWVIGKRLDAERELACDEIVAGRSGARVYARTLVHVAEIARSRNLGLAPGALRGNLTRRIESLLSTGARTRRSARRVPALGALPVLALAVVLSPGVATVAEELAAISGSVPERNLAAIRSKLMSTFQAFADSGFSGSVLIASGDSIILEQGYGMADRERGIATDAGTLYSVAGFTKMFTAAAILVLEEEGLLEVTDSISKFFPSISGSAGRVTIHQLLTHTDGMTRHNAPIYRRERDTFVRAMAATPDSFPPGTGYRYNDFGHSMLAAIIEVATQRSFESFVRDRFFRPAGLAHTGFEGEGLEMAREYSGTRGQYPVPDRGYTWGRRGSLGMVSTVGDMYRWFLALDNPNVIPARVRTRMLRTYERTDWGADQGYGWDLTRLRDGSRLWRRVAGTPGMEGELLHDDANRWTAVLLVNSRVGWRFRIWDKIAHAMNRSVSGGE